MSQAAPGSPPAAAPSLPLAIALAVAPVAGVLQSKALAPIALAALLGCVLLHRRRHGAWPWPRGALAAAALALFAWGAVTALWALQPWRALGTALQLGGFVALGAAAARAVAADTVQARQRLMLAATGGLVADKATKKNFDPAQKVGIRLSKIGEQNGIILRSMTNDSIGFSPPLIITEEEVDEMLNRFGKSLDEIAVTVRRESLAAV